MDKNLILGIACHILNWSFFATLAYSLITRSNLFLPIVIGCAFVPTLIYFFRLKP